MSFFGLNSWTISFDATLITIVLLSFYKQARIKKNIATCGLTQPSQLLNTKFYYRKEFSFSPVLMCLPLIILTCIAFFNPSEIGRTGAYHYSSLVIMLVFTCLAGMHFTKLITTNYIELTPEAFLYTVLGAPKMILKGQIESIEYAPYDYNYLVGYATFGKGSNIPRIRILYRKDLTSTKLRLFDIETDHYALPATLLLEALNHWHSGTESNSANPAINT